MATGVLIPIAISSHFDKSGDERVHAAGYYPYLVTTKPEYSKYLTSLPYDQIFYDNVLHDLFPTDASLVTLLFEANMQPTDVLHSLVPTGGEMVEVAPPTVYDAVNQSLTPTGGQLLLPPPGTMADDEVNIGLTPTNGRLSIPPLGTMNPDKVNIGLTPTGGTMGDTTALPIVSELQFAGADASTVFTDTTGKVWTANGNAQIDTSLGDQRGQFDGAGDYITTPHHTDLALAGDFDIQFILRYTALTGIQTIISKGYTPTATAGSWVLQTLSGNGRLAFYDLTTTTPVLVCQESTNAVINTDYTIRVARLGSTVTIWRNGVAVAAGQCTNTFSSNTPLVIGGGSTTGYNNYWFNGRIKSLVIRN